MRRAQGQGAEAFLAVQLTPRAIDILWGIAKGFRYADVADHLGISRQTVPCHIKNIYRKLEVHTRGEPKLLSLRRFVDEAALFRNRRMEHL